MNKLFFLISFIFLAACAVGPDYVRPAVDAPKKFKEAPKGWKIATPSDSFNRGKWWEIFHDAQLNSLEESLNISNQTIATTIAQHEQAQALVDEARAAYFPTLSTALSITRQKSSTSITSTTTSAGASSNSSSTSTGTAAVSGSGGSSGPSTNNLLTLNASWEPDLWGAVRRTVEASVANEQAVAAQLALVRLSSQASLAQYYFELRGVDRDQKLLNETVNAYKEILKLTKDQYASGTAALADVVQAQSQLEVSQAQAINVGIARAQYEHAIAVLIGKPVADFSLRAISYRTKIFKIPLEFPSEMLERRPDVAQAERLMAQASAQIGIAISTYFPTITLTASGSASAKSSIGNWIANPLYGWSLGVQAAETIFDGGLRNATINAARANYRGLLATYRQTVLAAFQDVEDNLVSVRLLQQQQNALDKAARDAKLSLKLVLDQYRSGVVPFSSVMVAETNSFAAEKNAADVNYLRMTSTVGLIKALGGGWSVDQLHQTS